MKKALLLISALLLFPSVMMFAGGTQEGAAAEKVELRISWWGTQSRHERTLKVIEMYQTKNPNIEIVAEPMGWGGYWEKMAIQVAGKNLPDVFQHSYAYLADYAKKGLLADLGKFTKDSILDLRNVDKSFLHVSTVAGTLYGVSTGGNVEALTYDPEIFRKAGAKLPEINWTWDDFKAVALKIKDFGIYISHSPQANRFETYLRETGKNLLKDDYSALSDYDDSLFADFYKMQLELMEVGAMPPAELFTEIESLDIEDGLIIHGKEAMYWSGANQVVALSNAAGRPLKLAMTPRIGVGKSGSAIVGMSLCVAETSENKQEAVKFINYFINDIEANKILLAERGVPVSSRVREALKPLLTPVQLDLFNFLGVVSKNITSLPFQAGVSEVNVKLPEQIREEIVLGVITPEEGAKKYRKLANEALARKK